MIISITIITITITITIIIMIIIIIIILSIKIATIFNKIVDEIVTDELFIDMLASDSLVISKQYSNTFNRY